MMHFRHDAEIAHRTDGRVRLRVPGRFGDERFFAEAVTQVAGLDGVSAVRANHYSASIIIEHDNSFELSNVTEALIAAAALKARDAEKRPEHTRHRTGTDTAVGILQFAFAVYSGGPLGVLVEFAVRRTLRVALRSIGGPIVKNRTATA